jgi:type IV pilus assembly protein PilO
MANPFRDMSVVMQALVAVAIAVILVLVGLYLPLSPVAQKRGEYDQAVQARTKLNQEVTQLQVYKQRYGELKQQMDALNKQLDTLKTIVPEEKEVDEFIRQIQGAATASNVQLRKLTAGKIDSKEYHYEMPFEAQADGPYFNVLDFFSRLSRLSRIINVGDLQLDDPGATSAKETKYPLRPGTTVTGIFTITTYFTKQADTPLAAAGAMKAAPGLNQPAVKKP